MVYAPGDVFALRSSGAVQRLFDGVVAGEAIEHVAHPDAFLREIASMLRPGGYVFLSTPNGGYVRNRLPSYSEISDPAALEAVQFRPGVEGHLFLLTNRELATLASEAGLTVESLENLVSPVLAGEWGLRRTFRFVPRRAIEATDRALEHVSRSTRQRLMLHTVAVLRKEKGTTTQAPRRLVDEEHTASAVAPQVPGAPRPRRSAPVVPVLTTNVRLTGSPSSTPRSTRLAPAPMLDECRATAL
jgi:hypothetical protein